MEYSTNFNFALPSRDNDVDLADINEISNNFRKIDENAVIKEVGKGLSTNDFTDEYKAKVENALTSENIDQTYSPTSENAQSGVAVAEAMNNVANAIKKTASGNPILINDASPIKHTLDVKTTANETVYIRGKNLIPFNNKAYYNGRYAAGQTYVKNGVSFTVNDDGSVYAKGTATGNIAFTLFSAGSFETGVHTVTLSGSPDSSSATTYSLRLRNAEATSGVYSDYGNGVTVNNTSITKATVAIIVNSGAIIDTTFYPMLEFGNVVSEFKSPTDAQSVNTDENGCASVVSFAENMSIFTETSATVECTYNRDTEKAIEEQVNSVKANIKYTPVLLLDTTLTEEVAEIIVNEYDGKPFYCNEVYAQFDIPKTPTSVQILFSALRKTGLYYILNNNLSTLKTIPETDTTNIHTLGIVKSKWHNDVYVESDYGGQKSNNANVHFKTYYPNIALNTKSGVARTFDKKGTNGFRLNLNRGVMLPIGTQITVWGFITE